jgi:hypothetical protein
VHDQGRAVPLRCCSLQQQQQGTGGGSWRCAQSCMTLYTHVMCDTCNIWYDLVRRGSHCSAAAGGHFAAAALQQQQQQHATGGGARWLCAQPSMPLGAMVRVHGMRRVTIKEPPNLRGFAEPLGLGGAWSFKSLEPLCFSG